MTVTKLAPGIWSVGVVDWDIRYFHGPTYSTHRGTSYNAFLIVDEKVALIDTVYGPFRAELLDNIQEIIDPAKIDVLVVNHLEPDHTGAVPTVMEKCPNAKVICSGKGKEGLIAHYKEDWDYQVVKTGDTIGLGKYTLQFVEAPMLHWPDSMFTYIPELALLMPNDAFGQHFASNKLFDDENDIELVMAEAAKYYANILSPFSRLVVKKLEELQKLGLEIKMIAPSHGIIWRSEPERIVEAYRRWASGETEERVVVAYDTMWGSTEKLARAIVEGLTAEGVATRMFKISVSDRNDIMAELLNARGVIIGSSTINNDLIPVVAPVLEEIRGLKPINKLGAAFGAYGWRGGAVKSIEKFLSEGGVKLASDAFTIQWVPEDEELEACRTWAADFARKIKEQPIDS
ncbi:MAG: MBL fold metallo-hydrolase [Firmicutes bacterium]|nr:MBL fold metallo-hydrolase [Bacillota bacterium]